MNGVKAILLLLAAGALACCQTSGNDLSQPKVISMPDLGFRCTLPAGMMDHTSSASLAARKQAASNNGKTALLLLDMSSDAVDTVPDWHQMWIFTFPRGHLSNLSDSAAEAKINTALAGPRATPMGQPRTVTIAGRNFLVSDFEQKEPPLLKHATTYTTICKTQLVSFVFVSNSAEQLKAMEQTMQTLSFTNP